MNAYCKKEFKSLTKRKTCNRKCQIQLMSNKRIKYIMERGKDIDSKRSLLNYKMLINFPCDSKLERAALKYLIDILEVEKIEKFKSILSFKDNKGQTRKFNPDFYVKKGNNLCVVEVKMKWKNKSNNSYYKTIPEKKKCLQEYCNRKGFEMIWLDFDYDEKFKELYKNELKIMR